MADGLHERLISLQSIEELQRKQEKAFTKHYWTQEDIDLADRNAQEMADYFKECETR